MSLESVRRIAVVGLGVRQRVWFVLQGKPGRYCNSQNRALGLYKRGDLQLWSVEPRDHNGNLRLVRLLTIRAPKWKFSIHAFLKTTEPTHVH